MGIKNIWQSMQKSAERLNQKSLDMPEGNLVLLHDHPEGHNKIHNRYKSEEFVIGWQAPIAKCILY